jgi:hypothetical protein
VIAGPSQHKYQEKLQVLAQRLGIADRITWTGMLQGDMKWGAFYASEAYVLSSHQENFGIAVAEALGCGVPVLISDKVNIWREIEADGAGIVNQDTLAGTKESLKHWLALDETARQQMGANAKRCFEERFTVEAMAKSLLAAQKKWLGAFSFLSCDFDFGDLVTMTIVDVLETDVDGKLLSYCPTFDNRDVRKTPEHIEMLIKGMGQMRERMDGVAKSPVGKVRNE